MFKFKCVITEIHGPNGSVNIRVHGGEVNLVGIWGGNGKPYKSFDLTWGNLDNVANYALNTLRGDNYNKTDQQMYWTIHTTVLNMFHQVDSKNL